MSREPNEIYRYSERDGKRADRYRDGFDRPEPATRARKPRIPPKMMLFLVALAAIVYGVRGAGSGSAQWTAALVTALVLVAIVVGKVFAYALRKRRNDAPDSDDTP